MRRSRYVESSPMVEAPSSRDTSHFIASIEKIVFENDIEERLLKFRNS